MKRVMMLADIGTLVVNSRYDLYCVRLAYRRIMAKRELQEFFKPKMDEDRAFNLGKLVHFDDEEQAIKYVNALTISKANKYGSPAKNG